MKYQKNYVWVVLHKVNQADELLGIFTSKKKAVNYACVQFAGRLKFDWMDTTAQILNIKNEHIGWIMRYSVK